MKKNMIVFNQSGQSLAILMVFITIIIVITSGAVMMTITNSQTTSQLTLGDEARNLAESGAENAILRLLRDPGYTGETLTIGEGTATITVTGNTDKVVTIEAVAGEFKSLLQITGTMSGNTFSVSSWDEI